MIATDGENPFDAALSVISVPATHERLAFILSAMAGHLFGYEAALAIDAQARPLREGAQSSRVSSLTTPPTSCGPARVPSSCSPGRRGRCSRSPVHGRSPLGGLQRPSRSRDTAVKVSSLFRYATGTSSLDSYQSEFGKVGTPGVVLDDLTTGLTAAIEELDPGPIDAIKHQAKTVTVGISRSDESLLQVPLVLGVLEAGALATGCLMRRSARSPSSIPPSRT